MLLTFYPDDLTASLARHVGLKDRDVYTREGSIRLRYRAFLLVSVFAGTLALGTLTAAGVAGMATLYQTVIASLSSPQDASSDVVLAQDAALPAAEPARVAAATSLEVTPIINAPVAKALLPALPPAKPVQPSPARPDNATLTLAAGETLSGLLTKVGLSTAESAAAIDALRPHMNPRSLRSGQQVEIAFQKTAAAANDSADRPRLSRLALPVDPLRTVIVEHAGNDHYRSHVREKPVEPRRVAGDAVIQSSLFEAAATAAIPRAVVQEALKVLSHQVDFQRQAQRGDRLEVFYDSFVTDDGYVARTGELHYVGFENAGRMIRFYRFEDKDGRVDYYDDEGRSIRKTLLTTPVDGARLSSGFGMRMHPILGYSKMHKGVDFAAPTGTPIYAAGDGRIEKMGWMSGYGKYIRIRHNGKLSTAYAHMSRFNPDLKSGSRVRQGDVIGYVGTTGRSTGPHLHYEVLVNNTQVNPRSLDLPTGQALTGRDLRVFRQHIDRIQRDFERGRSGIRLASAQSSVDAQAGEQLLSP